MAEVREVRVQLGLSIDKKGVWVKGDAGITVTLRDGDSVPDCFKRAFELADDSLSEQMKPYLEGDDNETT